MGSCRAGFLLLIVLAVGLAAAQTPKPWQPAAFPNPKSDFQACGREVPGNICDPDLVLSTKSKDYVAGVLKAIWEGDKPYALADCGGKAAGYQVAVAVMRRIVVPAGSTPAQTAHDFAKALHAAWGVGDAACENGVVLVLAIEDRQVYVSTGTGSKKALTAERIEDVVADMRPSLRRQDYDAAVERAVVDIGLALAGGKAGGVGVDWFGVAFFGVLAAVVGGNILKAVRRKREYGACRRALAKIKREQENLRSHAWSCPQSCPICLEDFTVPRPAGSQGVGAADDDDNNGKAKARGGDGAGTSAAYGSGLDAEAGPSTSLLHSGGATSEEEFARMSAAGQAAVRRLRQRRRAGPASAAGGGAPSTSAGGWADGAGPSTAAASGGGEEAQEERVPVTLFCGHTFCLPCLDKWLDKGVTCPVCRKPISDGSSPQDSGEAAGHRSSQQAQQGARLADDWLAADLAFRLGVLQTRYPLYITPSMVDTWRSEAQTTGSFNWETSRDFQLADPGARQHYESSGAGGFAASFGGGTGFGGGGGGGSW